MTNSLLGGTFMKDVKKTKLLLITYIVGEVALLILLALSIYLIASGFSIKLMLLCLISIVFLALNSYLMIKYLRYPSTLFKIDYNNQKIELSDKRIIPFSDIYEISYARSYSREFLSLFYGSINIGTHKYGKVEFNYVSGYDDIAKELQKYVYALKK